MVLFSQANIQAGLKSILFTGAPCLALHFFLLQCLFGQCEQTSRRLANTSTKKQLAALLELNRRNGTRKHFCCTDVYAFKNHMNILLNPAGPKNGLWACVKRGRFRTIATPGPGGSAPCRVRIWPQGRVDQQHSIVAPHQTRVADFGNMKLANSVSESELARTIEHSISEIGKVHGYGRQAHDPATFRCVWCSWSCRQLEFMHTSMSRQML